MICEAADADQEYILRKNSFSLLQKLTKIRYTLDLYEYRV